VARFRGEKGALAEDGNCAGEKSERLRLFAVRVDGHDDLGLDGSLRNFKTFQSHSTRYIEDSKA
jgi:hypothetical protein